VPVFGARGMRDLLHSQVAGARLRAVILSGFAGTALMLAMIGLFSVIAHAVSARTSELGLRIALGARPSQVVGLAMRGGLVWSLAGLAAGLAGSLVLTRYLRSILYDVSTSDPLIFVSVGAALFAAAALASYLPARRAAALDPVETLRAV
jgi:putative ABC transport system permease protein